MQRGRGRPLERYTARFEFSMLPAAGGSVIPHTDNPEKVVTIVINTLSIQPISYSATTPGGTSVTNVHLPSTGVFDSLGPLEEPTGEEVRLVSASAERARIYITSHGLTTGITLSDFVP